MTEQNNAAPGGGLQRLSGLWPSTGKTSGKLYLGGKVKDEITIPAGSRIMVFSRIPQPGDSPRMPHYSVCYALPEGYVNPSNHLHQPLQEQTGDFNWPQQGQPPQQIPQAPVQQAPAPQQHPAYAPPPQQQAQQPVYVQPQQPVTTQAVQATLPVGAQVTVKENSPF